MSFSLSSLFRRARRPEGPLGRDGRLVSDLWLDRPDALERLEERVEEGAVPEELAPELRRWVEEGYMRLALDFRPAWADDVEATVERLWREKPTSVALAYQAPLKLFACADEAADRRPSYRIADLHSESAGARALYLHPAIHRAIGAIFGETPVAVQSLYFEHGSGQALHRDPVHVYTSPPSHLVGAWIALEDIRPESGPLTYVPGSHRLPYYEVEPGEYRFNHAVHGPEAVEASQRFDLEQCDRHGLRAESFTPRRGEVLLWHASLLHGGSERRDPTSTRKSLVIHFSTKADYRRLRQTVRVCPPGSADGPEAPSRVFGTDRLLESDGCYGFDNPLRGNGDGGPTAG